MEYFLAMVNNRMPHRPELWDGNTAGRIVGLLVEMNDKIKS
jgi:hypothetical protein